MYTPQNLAIFTAAFAGALAGMGASGRVISDPVSLDYSGTANVAGAYAQAVDTIWAATQTTDLDVQTIEEISEAAWQDRSPQAIAPFNSPANWTNLANAIVALAKSGDSYYDSQGIVSPLVPGSAALQLIWYVNANTGSDNNDGSLASPVKTVARVCDVLHNAKAGVNYRIICKSDIPDTDRFRFSFLAQTNLENVNAAGASQGYQQVFNVTVEGERTVLASSVLTGTGILITAGANQATLQDAAMNNAAITANINKMIVLTSGPNAGATAFIGAGPAEDATLAANTARISALVNPDGTNPGNQAAGVTYDIVALTKFAPAMTQTWSTGRYAFLNLNVPPVPAQPANQQITTYRFSTIAINFCLWEKVLDLSTQHLSAQGSAFTFSDAQLAASINKMTINALGVAAFLNCMFRNVDCIVVKTSDITLVNSYLEKSWIETVVTGFFVNYGYFQVANGVCHGGYIKVLGAQGLSVYNWNQIGNTSKSGILLTDGSLGRFSAGIRGVDTVAGSIGVLVRNSSKLLFASAAAHAATSIAGVDAEIRIFNPSVGGAQNLAVAVVDAGAGNPMTVAGAVTYVAAALNLWADLSAAPFKGFAQNQFDQSLVAIEAA